MKELSGETEINEKLISKKYGQLDYKKKGKIRGTQKTLQRVINIGYFKLSPKFTGL